MSSVETSGPVIVMVEAESGNEMDNIHQWFENSRFKVFDAVNIFDALEAMSDFTVGFQHDVVLLNVDCFDADMPMIRTTFAAVASDVSPQFVSLKNCSDSPSLSNCYQGDLAHVAAHLERLIPDHALSIN